MNAYKEWQEGNITDAEYNSICLEEMQEYMEFLKAINSDEEGWIDDDGIDEI